MLSPSIVDHLFFFIVGIALPMSNLLRSNRSLKDIEFDTATKTQLYYSNGLVIWIGAFIALGLWWYQSRSFIELGFRPPEINGWTIGLTLAFIAWYTFDLYWQTQFAERRKKAIARWKKYTPFMPVNREELQHFNFLAVSAGIGEEIVFRGFFITYLISMLGSWEYGAYLAVIIPALVFAIGHIYQGWRAVFKIFLLAILFGYLFLFSKSLWIVMVLHILLDMISGYVTMRLIQTEEN